MIRGTQPAKLRVGIMCNGMSLRHFQLESLFRVLEIPDVEPALLILDARPASAPFFPDEIPALSRPKGAFWPIYTRLTGLEAGGPLELRDASSELKDIPQIPVTVSRKGEFSECFSDQDVEVIRGHKLDLILKFGFGILEGAVLTAARYGVWAYHHDDPAGYRGSPPAFWEIHQQNPVSGAVLQRLTEGQGGGILLRSCFVKTTLYSYKKNLTNVLNASIDMPALICKDILNGTADYVDGPPCSTSAPIYKLPTNFEVLSFMAKCGGAWIRDQFQGMTTVDSWNVGVVHAPIEKFLEADFKPDVKWLPYKRKKMFIADPFIESSGEQTEILAEEFDYDLNRGYIVRVRVNARGQTEVEQILDDKRHLSYPYVLRHNGVKYVIPESSAAREIALYRVDEPDGRLTKVCALVKNFAGLDATLIRHDGRWWMFATDAHGAKDSNLHLWHAEALEGPWIPHAVNPVKVDIRSSRPAGTPFHHGGVLYRPAQNCSVTYGGSTTINRVLCLTPVKFQEEPVRELRHDRNSEYRYGFHTLAAGDGITVIDGRCDEVNTELVRRKLTHKLRRAFGLSTYPATRVPEYADAATPDRE